MRITKYNTLLKDGVPSLVKEKACLYRDATLCSPEGVVAMLNEVFLLSSQTEECLYLIASSSKGRVLGVFEVSRGTVSSSMAMPREIYLKALLAGAATIIIAHNHPSGVTAPSTQDIEATKRIQEAGKLIGIPLLDHIIVGQDEFYSFNQAGIINT